MYYDNATGNALWSDLASWWTVSAGGTPAVSLPATGDTVFLTGNVTQSGYEVEVANLTITGSFTLNCILTVNGSATFATTSKNGGIVNGTCVLNTSAENNLGALINGSCTFNGSSLNKGTVEGATSFTGSSINKSTGVVNGATTFDSTSSIEAVGAAKGIVNGAVTMNSASVCAGVINGAVTMNSTSSVTTAGVINGSVTMNGTCTMAGTINGSTLTVTGGTVTADGIVNVSTATFTAGTSYGTITAQDVNFFSAAAQSSSSITITGYATFTGAAGGNQGTVSGTGAAVFSTAASNTGTIQCSRVTFSGASYSTSTAVITCDASFLITSYNDGAITADSVTFDDTSYNTGTVTSNDCKVYKSSGNSTGVIVGVGNFFGDTGSGIYANNTGGTVTGSTNSYWPATYPVGGTVSVSSNYFGYAFLQGQAQVGVRGIVDTLGIQDTVSLGTIYGETGLIARGTMNVPVTLSRSLCKSGVKGTLRLTTADAGFTVKQALSAIYSVWGSGCSDSCDTAYTARGSAALDILNGCMQEIVLNAKELQYLSRETITVATTSVDNVNGLTYMDIPENVQAVVGPVVVKLEVTSGPSVFVKAPLVGVSTKSQLMNFSTYYNTNGGNRLYAYWIDRAYQTDGERTRIRIYLDYDNDQFTEAYIDVEREALRYRAADCASGTVIPLPHQYAESLLLPLLREAASASPLASRRDSFPMYQAAAASARTRFAMADPQNPTLEPKPERSRKP